MVQFNVNIDLKNVMFVNKFFCKDIYCNFGVYNFKPKNNEKNFSLDIDWSSSLFCVSFLCFIKEKRRM